MIKNLTLDTDEDMLRNVFKTFGNITRCFIPFDKDSNKRKGFAFMDFENDNEATEAMKFNSDIDGNQISIVYARPKKR